MVAGSWPSPVVVAAMRSVKRGDELFGDAGLDVDAVGGDAGLAAVAQFGEHGTFDSLFEVGVIEHDQGCVAAQFHGGVHDVACRLGEQDLSDLGGAGEGDLADAGIGHDPCDHLT